MEKEDIEEFREAIQKMSDEENSETKEEIEFEDSKSKLLEEYRHETEQLVKENEALKQENHLLSNRLNQENIKDEECELESKECLVMETELVEVQEVLDSNVQDDLSSIFSEDEEDLKSLVEGNDTIRKALRNLRKERNFWMGDTASETSDDCDVSISARSIRGSSVDRIQINQLLAEKELLELKLSQVTSEKKDTETKLRYMEKSEKKRRHETTSARLNQSEPSSRIEIQHSKQELNKKQKISPRSHTKQHKKKEHGMTNSELMNFLQSRSISPQLVKGYEDDIALLAKENEKLGEIIDHIHVYPEENQSPPKDPMAAFMEAYEHRVPQEDYMRLESDKMRLEHLVREKDRQIKERDRIIEETKLEYEDELKLLKDNLKRSEGKLRDRSKQLNEYEIQIIELRSAFEEQIVNIQSELHMGNERKMSLEEMNAGLMENNRKFQIEIENLKISLSKLNARERDIEKKYKRQLMSLEEKYLSENQEKTQLSGNLEGLMSDLMVLKTKLLENGNKTSKMRENFEKERQGLGGEALDVNPRFANLSIHLKNRSQGEKPTKDEQSHDQVNTYISQSINDYTIIIEEQRNQIETLQEANQVLNDKLSHMARQNESNNVETDNDIKSQNTQTEASINISIHEGEKEEKSKDIQEKPLLERNETTSRPSSALKYEMEELERENAFLKSKVDELGQEKIKRKELEEINKELQEEINLMTKKRNELQKKQEAMSEEIDQMTEKVEELEKSNAKLTNETDQLTNKMKEMEETFDEEKEKLALSFEVEKEKQEKALETYRERIAEMEETVKKLEDEVTSLKKQNKEIESKYNEIGEKDEGQALSDENERMKNEIEELKIKFVEEMENLKNTHKEEIVQTEQKASQELEDEWQQKIKDTIDKYEKQLEQYENEKKDLLLAIEKSKTVTANNFQAEIRPDSAVKVESEVLLQSSPNSGLFAREENVSTSVDNVQEEIIGVAKIAKTDDYIASIESEKSPTDQAYHHGTSEDFAEMPLSEEIAVTSQDIVESKGDIELELTPRHVKDLKEGSEDKIDDSRNDIILKKTMDEVDVTVTQNVPNVQIQVELQETANDLEMRPIEHEKGDNQYTAHLQKELNDKQNEILMLTQKIGQLQQQLTAKEGEIALLNEREKNASVIFQTKMDEKTKYYQDLLEKLKTTLQGEKKELEDRLNKDSEEMQRLMKEELQKSLTSKSGVLGNKIQELIADKVRVYKEQMKKLEVQLQEAKEKVYLFENGDDDRTKRLEREKKVLRVTIQALSKELNKAKQERKELKKICKKGKVEMRNAADKERMNFQETLEKTKEVQKLKIEEELRIKYSVDVERYEQKLEKMNDEILQYENKMEEMVMRFKEEKYKLENELQESFIELENLKESQETFKSTLEEDYKCKLRKEKKTIETTLENLRQEISRLRENRQHLESQLQQNGHLKHDKDTMYRATSDVFNNKEIFNRIETEYQQQLQREKEYYETKIRDLEADYESLTEEISQIKAKFRQERMTMKAEFEREKASLEERFENERMEIQASIHFRMQNMRETRVGLWKKQYLSELFCFIVSG